MKKAKIVGAVFGVILFIAAIAGITYAFISWTSENINKVVESKCFEIFYEKGNDITGSIMPSYEYTGGLSTTVKMDINPNCNMNANGKLYLVTDEDTSSNLYRTGLLNYQVLINDTVTDIKGNITSTGEIEIDLGPLSKNTSAVTEYTLYIWINYNLVTNSDVSLVYSGSLRAEAIQEINDK